MNVKEINKHDRNIIIVEIRLLLLHYTFVIYLILSNFIAGNNSSIKAWKIADVGQRIISDQSTFLCMNVWIVGLE